jgi:hypothetical protein
MLAGGPVAAMLAGGPVAAMLAGGLVAAMLVDAPRATEQAVARDARPRVERVETDATSRSP